MGIHRGLGVCASLLSLIAALACASRPPSEGSQAPEPRAPVEAAGSGCLGLADADCRANPQCEAIPYWGESLVACNVDERGFADNCPSEGCRPLGSDCPTLDTLIKTCPRYCSYNNFGVDPATGCRTCDCRGG